MTLPTPTDEQTQVLYLPPEGHTVVIGSAGCGKTTMSLYRALHLSTSQLIASGDTALITYNQSLRNWMEAVLDGEGPQIEVLTFHGWARSVLESVGVDMAGYLSDPAVMESLTARAFVRIKRQSRSRTFDRPEQFFSDELRWIDGMGIGTLEHYLEVNRTGRGETRLGSDDRTDVWNVRDHYRYLRQGAGFSFDLRDVASVILNHQEAADASPLHHVVIDEGQDLTPQMLRSIAYASPGEGSLTFFGDPTQQIYGKQMSWRSAGFNIRKQWLFDRNHRNTRQIAELAAAVGADASEASIGRMPRRSGDKPSLTPYTGQDQEITGTVQAARAAVTADRLVAVLSRTHEPAEAVAHAARETGLRSRRLSRDTSVFDAGVLYWGTVHAAKGLEFDDVFVVGLNDQSWPDPAAVDRSDRETATDQDRKLLYVAVTRARDQLALSYVGHPTDLLPTDVDLYQ